MDFPVASRLILPAASTKNKLLRCKKKKVFIKVNNNIYFLYASYAWTDSISFPFSYMYRYSAIHLYVILRAIFSQNLRKHYYKS